MTPDPTPDLGADQTPHQTAGQTAGADRGTDGEGAAVARRTRTDELVRSDA